MFIKLYNYGLNICTQIIIFFNNFFKSICNFKFFKNYILFFIFIFFIEYFLGLYSLILGVNVVYLTPPKVPIQSFLDTLSIGDINVRTLGDVPIDIAYKIVYNFKNLAINKHCFAIVNYRSDDPVLSVLMRKYFTHPIRHPHILFNNLYSNYFVGFQLTTDNYSNFLPLTKLDVLTREQPQYISNSLHIYDTSLLYLVDPNTNQNWYENYMNTEYDTIAGFLQNFQKNIIL